MPPTIYQVCIHKQPAGPCNATCTLQTVYAAFWSEEHAQDHSVYFGVRNTQPYSIAHHSNCPHTVFMSLKMPTLALPDTILFDWHATLVDTHSAMYLAMDDMLARLDELGLGQYLLPESDSRTPENARLLAYVKKHRRLHPKVSALKKVSRTDILELLFGDNDMAKTRAHQAFDEAYQDHIEEVFPMEPDMRTYLETLRFAGLRLGVISNRRRDFLVQELEQLDGTGWSDLFDVTVCGTDVARRKPAPDALKLALDKLGVTAGAHVWYVGDSSTDMTAAHLAGITPIFYNGARWSDAWIERNVPGTADNPHRPATVVSSIAEVVQLAQRGMRGAQGETHD